MSLWIKIFSPISWHPQKNLRGTWQSFINWKHAQCTSLFNGKFDAKAKWGKLHWPALGHFKQCYILIRCQVSRWWEDSHQSPASFLKEGDIFPYPSPPQPPKHKQMQSCWYRWTSGKKYSKPPVFTWRQKNDKTGQLGSLCLGTPSTSYLVNTFIIFVYSNTCHFVIIPSIHVTVGCCCCSVVRSSLTLCDPHGLQHTRLPCPSQSPSLPNFRSIELVIPSLKVLLLLFYMYAFLYSGLKIWPPTIYLYSSSLNMFEL